MNLSKPKVNSCQEDERFLSRSYSSKDEFIKEYERFYYGTAKAKDLYFLILTKLQTAITEGNIDKFKRFAGLIDYISGVESAATLETYHYDKDNPIKKGNFIILACKHDEIEFLNYVFSNSRLLFGLTRDVRKDSIAPDDKDESNHDAFYYAIRSGDIKLLDTLITKWPGDYFGTRPAELDEVLSTAYEELKFRNVSLSDEMEIFVENKLISLRFFSNSSRLVQSAKSNVVNILERVNLVLENIDLLKTEYSNDKKVDERFLFVARFIALNINVLKRQVKVTYDRLPWEEIEFCLVSFVSSYVKKQEINLFYRTILNKSKLLLYLENFAKKLENCKSFIETSSIGKLSGLPKLKRDDVIAKIINDNPQFTELYADYQQIRDIYSLERINSYLNLALSINPEEREGQLIITRALQVIGEYLKNTLESPNISATASELILLSLPKHTRKIIVDLRNSLSHVYSLSKRTEIEENNVNFFIGVQKDAKRIDDVITDFLYSNKIKMVKILLNEIINNKGLEEIKAVAEVMNNIEVDKMMSHKSVSSELENVENLIRKLIKVIPDKTSDEKELFSQINDMINIAKGKSEKIRTDYSSAFRLLQGLSVYLSDDTLDPNTPKIMKAEATNAFECMVPEIEACSLKKIIELSMDICCSVKARIKSEEFDKVNRLSFDLYTIAQFGVSDMKWIDKLREKLCQSSSIPMYKRRATFDMTDDEFNKQLTRKLSELESILLKNQSDGNLIDNLPSYCRNKKLLAIIEMLVLDIMSILGRSEKYLENNLLFTDDNTPLLTGKCLRNHLAHGNTLLDVLLSDPSSAVILNAEKLVSENVVKSNKKIGKLVKDDSSKLKDKFDRSLDSIANQDKMFSALQKGNLKELRACLKKGADIKAQSINPWTSLHFAARSPSLAMVKLVLDLGFDANVKDSHGQTPLHIAAAHGRTDIVKFFVEELAVPVDDADNYNRTPLHLAAKKGHKSVVEILLKNNANTTIRDGASCYSPLHYAIQNNHIAVFKILLEKETNVDVNQLSGGYTPLHIAAEHGCIEMVDILLKRGANVNHKHDKEGTPLHAATQKGHVEIANILIRHGANVNAVIFDGSTPLLFAVEFDHAKITEILLKHEVNINVAQKISNKTPLHLAARNGREEIVEMLLKRKANVNCTTSIGLTPLHWAVQRGHLKTAATLIKHGGDVRAKSKTNVTPLHIAAQAGNKEIIQLLIENGAEVNAKTNEYVTPLHLAAEEGRADVVELLLKSKAKVDVRNIEGDTPVYAAARKGHTDVVDLLKKYKANLKVKTDDGTTLLHIASITGHRELVIYLIKNNFNVNIRDNDGITPLHAAVMGGREHIVKLLLEKGAKVDATSTISEYDPLSYVNLEAVTPLYMAVQVDRKDIVEILLANGADVKAVSPLRCAILHNRKDIVKVLVANGATIDYQGVSVAIHAGYKEILDTLLDKLVRIDWKDKFGNTLLHVATTRGHTEILKTLITRGVELNTKNMADNTPLYVAAVQGDDEIAEILVSNGADMNLGNVLQGTPLLIASALGHHDVVDVLLSNGADTSIRDFDGRTYVEIAVTYGNVSVLKTILRHKKINLNARLSDNSTLLLIAAQQKSLEMVKFLVEKGCNLLATDESGARCVDLAAREGNIDIVDFLISKGLHVNERGPFGQNVLHYAVVEGHSEMVKFLIAKGANVNAKDTTDTVPLHIAARYGHIESVEVLLENGAAYNAKDNSSQTPLEISKQEQFKDEDFEEDDFGLGDFGLGDFGSSYNRTETLKKKAVKRELLHQIFYSTQQLFEAVKSNSISELERCIKAGAVVNAKNADTESTALHFASWKGYDQIVRVLLQHKADPNAVCNKGFTPLHYAAKFSNLECVKTLLCHGSIYNAASNSDKTPSEFSNDEIITDLFKMIDESFAKIENNDLEVIADLQSIQDVDTLKIVLNARNKENKTLTAAAELIDWSLYELMKQIPQEDLPDRIEEASDLMNNGNYQEGIDMLKNLYKERKTILGADDPGTMQIQTAIAKGLYDRGNYQQALKLYEEILVKQKDILGVIGKDTLNTGRSIALVMIKMGKEEEASSVFQEIYSKQREILGPKHKDTLITYFHMGEVFLRQQNWEEALPICRSVYADMNETLGSRNPYTVNALNNIGFVLIRQGNKEEGLQIYEKVLEMKKLITGDDQSDSLTSLLNIGCSHLLQKKYHEALEVLQKALDIQKKTLPANHPDTLNTQYCIGNIYYDEGKYMSALRVYKECIEQRKNVFGPNDPAVVDILKKMEKINLKSKWEGSNPTEMLQYLQKDINVASSKGDVRKVESLLQDGADVNDKDIDGRTPLHYAVDSGHLNVVNILLENGADVTQTTNKGNTPLHTATSKGHKEIVDVLLKHVNIVNRDRLSDFVNAKTFSGGTASIHVAAKNGFLEVLKCLLNHGAIYNIANKEGKAPIDLAKDQKIITLLNLIEYLFEGVNKGDVEVISKLKTLKQEEFVLVTNTRNNQSHGLVQVAVVNKRNNIATNLLQMLKKSDP